LHESALGHFWEKLTRPEAQAKYPKIYREYYRWPGKTKAGGENLAKMAKRVLAVIGKEVKRNPGQNLVFVSHQDPILAALLKISRRDFNDLHKVKALCDTGAVCEVCSVGKKLINKTYLAP
jgi:broad specificity phosphatase PhoE